MGVLVYTSSASVVFDGDRDLKGVDESFPCASKVRLGSTFGTAQDRLDDSGSAMKLALGQLFPQAVCLA